MRWSSLVLLILLACTKKSSDGSEETGEPCTYDCAGQACNLKCVDDVIYRCPTSGFWELEEDCAAKGDVCQPVYEENGMQVDIECGSPDEPTDCGGPGSHSSINETTDECECDPGYVWCDIDDPMNYSCCEPGDVDTGSDTESGTGG